MKQQNRKSSIQDPLNGRIIIINTDRQINLKKMIALLRIGAQ